MFQRVLYGQDAAQYLLKKVEDSQPQNRNDDDLITLRNFQWLLGPSSRDVLYAWIESLVRQTKAAIVAHGMIADGAPQVVAASDASSSASGSSFSSGVAIVPSSTLLGPSQVSVPPSKKQRKDTSSLKDQMMKICCGKQ